jgi:hypothetical protein
MTTEQVDPAFAFTTASDDSLICCPALHDHAARLPKRHCFITATIFTILLHAYALAVLPAVMEVEFAPDQTETRDLNLENDEIGNDPDLLLMYQMGSGPPMTIPPPPGFGNNTGQGGGINLNEAVGILNAPDGPPLTIPPPTRFRSRTRAR